MRDSQDIILTTASTIEGYHIIDQLGIVFGETVFKHGDFATLKAGIIDAIDTIAWGSREMRGSVELIESAREYAYTKMIDSARSKGANVLPPICDVGKSPAYSVEAPS